MVQFSALAYSSRLVTWLSQDPTLFHALGLFIAIFMYAIAALAWTDRGGSGQVPPFSVFVVTVLLILSMVVFARLVQRLNRLQIGEVLDPAINDPTTAVQAIDQVLDAQDQATALRDDRQGLGLTRWRGEPGASRDGS